MQANVLGVADVEEIWVKYDKDESGHLDDCECEAFLTDLLKLTAGPELGGGLQKAKARMAEAMDADGNGRIDREE